MSYRLIDHTADLGIRVEEPDGPRLFAASATALCDLLWDPRLVRGGNTARIRVSGEDWPDLMVNWLRELLYFWSGLQRVVKGIAMDHFYAYGITAEVEWEPYDPARHCLRHEIKAVTYHQIAAGPMEEPSRGWQAQIIFDL